MLVVEAALAKASDQQPTRLHADAADDAPESRSNRTEQALLSDVAVASSSKWAADQLAATGANSAGSAAGGHVSRGSRE